MQHESWYQLGSASCQQTGATMVFFFPFYTEQSKPWAPDRGTSAKTLPLLPVPAKAAKRERDLGDFVVDLLRQVISAFTSSLTALGNNANAYFAQVSAALAMDRAGRSTMQLFAPRAGFGMPGTRPVAQQGFDPMSFSPMLTQGFNPLAMNPWAVFTESLNFWASLWMPPFAQPAASSHGKTSATPFMTKISTPYGFSFGFSWGA